jgi:Integron cassette protein VCH_CASS1 chain
MPVIVDDVSVLRAYLRGVLADAKHHANNVEEVILALAGAVISRQDEGSPLEVHSGKGGGLGRALTVTIGSNRFALSYDHGDKAVQLKAGSFQGPVVHKFTNATPMSEVARVFANL